jgi:hypothetical protein
LVIADPFGLPSDFMCLGGCSIVTALSLSLSDSGAVGVNGRAQAPFITDMTYESLVQLEDVRCVASSALVNSLPVYTFAKQEPVGPDQTLE